MERGTSTKDRTTGHSKLETDVQNGNHKVRTLMNKGIIRFVLRLVRTTYEAISFSRSLVENLILFVFLGLITILFAPLFTGLKLYFYQLELSENLGLM